MNASMKDQLKHAKQRGLKTRPQQKRRPKLFDTLGDALIAFYLNGGQVSKRIQAIHINKS